MTYKQLKAVIGAMEPDQQEHKAAVVLGDGTTLDVGCLIESIDGDSGNRIQLLATCEFMENK